MITDWLLNRDTVRLTHLNILCKAHFYRNRLCCVYEIIPDSATYAIVGKVAIKMATKSSINSILSLKHEVKVLRNYRKDNRVEHKGYRRTTRFPIWCLLLIYSIYLLIMNFCICCHSDFSTILQRDFQCGPIVYTFL